MHIAFYKANSPGLAGLYNRAVRWWTAGKYSHVELVFNDGMSASSSYRDGGVRFKRIQFDPEKWDCLIVSDKLESAARNWFAQHGGEAYDLLGNFHFVVSPVTGDKDKWFCSEAVAASLGLAEPWRYDPNSLYNVLNSITRGNYGRTIAG